MKTLVKTAVRRHRPIELLRGIAHLPNFIRLFLALLRDGRVTWFAKGLLLAGIVYAVAPIDILPDMIPLVGELDDLSLLLMACRTFLQLCPAAVVQEHVAAIDTSGRWRPFSS